METTINQRLKILIDWDKSNPERFAKTVGVSSAAIRKILAGDNEPSSSLTRSILQQYPKISTDWFILGEGEMLKNETKVSSSLTEQAFVELRNELNWQRSLIDRLIGKAPELSKFKGNRRTLQVSNVA